MIWVTNQMNCQRIHHTNSINKVLQIRVDIVWDIFWTSGYGSGNISGTGSKHNEWYDISNMYHIIRQRSLLFLLPTQHLRYLLFRCVWHSNYMIKTCLDLCRYLTKMNQQIAIVITITIVTSKYSCNLSSDMIPEREHNKTAHIGPRAKCQ